MTKRGLSAQQALAAAFGRNPLLEALGAPISVDEFPRSLHRNPLDLIKWQAVPRHQRTDLVPLLEQFFVSTPTAIDIACAIQQVIRSSYIARNPTLIQNQKKLYQVASFQATEFRKIPWFSANAKGLVISGITGMGKTTLYEQVLGLYPKSRVHGIDEESGWTELKQIVYLVVPMSAGKSRMGFLENILAAIDEAIGTRFHATYAGKFRSVEQAMVVVSIILHTHRCGALVIEEIQDRNFAPGEQRGLMLLFFLRLLNFGIPVILVGNPLGFVGFDRFTQDVRRLYKGGNFELWPADSCDDIGWYECYVRQKATFNLTGRELPDTSQIRQAIFECTAAVPDYFDTLWQAMQIEALHSSRRGPFTENDIKAVYNSYAMQHLHPLIDALVARNHAGLTQFEDIPADLFRKHWARLDPSDESPREAQTAKVPSPATARAPVKQARFQRNEAKSRTESGTTPTYIPETADEKALRKKTLEALKKESDFLREALSNAKP
ncbi:ATP-binding protein [Paraburkholderia sediminicola]|uniref:ATP-binding protein n=1 Tax=Paraburkholderia sediminicola TaxID=458836 RepID=UPI0038BBB367